MSTTVSISVETWSRLTDIKTNLRLEKDGKNSYDSVISMCIDAYMREKEKHK